ncbi:unnamed protein product [Diabrotica balteata]|uniref:ribonuclease III n=1 Tax=Diabrotica balteata TaxID=107213 RepID=A0A9N9T4I4_DIABA|nr:unnamed protein product [Diabrotica balteata]
MGSEELIPRNYQVLLMRICLEQNTIIYLPTGSGKTFITTMVLKQKGEDLLRSYSEGGKISIILVNTVALVDQHGSYITNHTSFSVGKYTGEMNLDFWPRTKWFEEFNKYQVLIMTSQILDNLSRTNFIDLNQVNLLVFDECHRGVNDHTMRNLMKRFEHLSDPPRVIGLTATLLNGNCQPHEVLPKIRSLETTFHSKVATVEELKDVIGYSTNPHEVVVGFDKHRLQMDELFAKARLEKIMLNLSNVMGNPIPINLTLKGLVPIRVEEGQKRLINLLKDLVYHIETMGIYGGAKACQVNIIKIERLKKHCDDMRLSMIFDSVQTMLGFITLKLQKRMTGLSEREQIYQYSSDQIKQLINIFNQSKKIKGTDELCCIVFTQRRSTAQILFHIFKALSRSDPEYNYIKSNFIVGHNSNPYNDTRELLYLHKKNKQILNDFTNKEINLLVSSNVLEEGVDVPKCSLVIKYDCPMDYRSYVQSKGRARHKESFYYVMVDYENFKSFDRRVNGYKTIEDMLNQYLIGKNSEREEISEEALQALYNEDEIPPYYVKPGGACVTMLSAISLLCQYCTSLASDMYSEAAPEWYKKENLGKTAVVILLPTGSKILDEIQGQFMSNIKLAKRAAAFKCCVLLHQVGELDDHLLPVKKTVKEEDVSFLFTHYPDKENRANANLKTRRLHKKMVPNTLKEQIRPSSKVYLHCLQLNPQFSRHNSDINQSTVYDMYTSSLSYGIITTSPLPTICDFPIYLTSGTIEVSLKVNHRSLNITHVDLDDIKTFHFNVFDSVLEILPRFLIFDTSDNAEMMLLVPVNKENGDIDWDVLRSRVSAQLVNELSEEQKLNLPVTQEGYLRKIVNPWYRRDTPTYIVTEVCFNKSAKSPFPNESFSSFAEYFRTKHNITLLNPDLPLLKVKGLTKNRIFIKPKGASKGKRKYDEHTELEEYLPPELVVTQEYPAPLWIQSNFLPTILSRISFMLQLEQLRCKIVEETGMGSIIHTNRKALQLDEYLLDYKPYVEEIPYHEDTPMDIDQVDAIQAFPLNSVSKINKEFTNKIIESQYPWKDIEEPLDVERDLDATVLDVEHYEQFLGFKLSQPARELKNISPIKKKELLALTYDKKFAPTKIKLLEIELDEKGPELCRFYRAFTCAKANDIVNLERLETLGDSFLKFISSVYIYLKFPQYNEGLATSLKGRLVSNKNLFYLAVRKNLQGIIKYHELSPQKEWLPPAFTIPSELSRRIENKELSLSSVFGFTIPVEEQISGVLSEETKQEIYEEDYPPTATEESAYQTMANFIKCQYIGDKFIADVVESLIGAYLMSGGFKAGVKIIEWIGIIPKSERLEYIWQQLSPNPLLSPLSEHELDEKIRYHLPLCKKIEEILGYTFKNKAYLLQALTHNSYTPNRTTLSYQKLEFLGDAVLDFLITCHIYESCENLDPGQLTDLRSALVNNNTFASLCVRLRLHTYLLMMNMQLQKLIDRFDSFMAQKDYIIDDEVLILLQEDEYQLAESVDVPKVLGDIFEAIAGAIYLDSNKCLRTVWDVFYKIMWKEIDLFTSNIPKNAIRRLFEWTSAHAKFGKTVPTENKKTMIPLQFQLNGIPTMVHGFGTNTAMAKKAAAKLALQLLLERKEKK